MLLNLMFSFVNPKELNAEVWYLCLAYSEGVMKSKTAIFFYLPVSSPNLLRQSFSCSFAFRVILHIACILCCLLFMRLIVIL